MYIYIYIIYVCVCVVCIYIHIYGFVCCDAVLATPGFLCVCMCVPAVLEDEKHFRESGHGVLLLEVLRHLVLQAIRIQMINVSYYICNK